MLWEPQSSVLILILMEDALREGRFGVRNRLFCVLILILMEDALRELEPLERVVLSELES